MRARQVLDTRDWEAADRLRADVSGVPWARAAYDFITAFAAYHLGRSAQGEALRDELRRQREGLGEDAPRIRIMEMELDALAARGRGDDDRAVAVLREAADLEATLPFEFGPPASPKPPHELLAEVLADLGRLADAEAAYRDALRFTPGRAPALQGLAAVQTRMGQGG
jgi:hypothetical protein